MAAHYRPDLVSYCVECLGCGLHTCKGVMPSSSLCVIAYLPSSKSFCIGPSSPSIASCIISSWSGNLTPLSVDCIRSSSTSLASLASFPLPFGDVVAEGEGARWPKADCELIAHDAGGLRAVGASWPQRATCHIKYDIRAVFDQTGQFLEELEFVIHRRWSQPPPPPIISIFSLGSPYHSPVPLHKPTQSFLLRYWLTGYLKASILWKMSWTDPQSWLSSMMGPSPLAIVVKLIVALSIPLFLHLVIYRSPSSNTLPSFLLIGPSGAGKTALLTLVY